MVSKVVTSVPRMNPPKLDQVGPLMRLLGLHKYVTISQLAPGAQASVRNMGDRALTLEYVNGVNKHQAGITVYDGGGRRSPLLCSYCTLSDPVAWCPHLHHVVSTGQDRSLYMPKDGETSEWGILVPIIPSEGVFAPVRFRLLPGKNGSPFAVAEALHEGTDIELGVLRVGEFGTLEVRAMYTDMMVGRRHDRSLFGEVRESRQPFTSTDDEFTRSAFEISKKLSSFSHQYYQAIWRKTLGELELAGSPASDAPRF